MHHEFRDTGLFVRPLAPCARVQVFGERCSGTNFVQRLLGRNTTLRPTDGLGWKHGAPAMAAIPADTVIMCIVRDARTWMRSMHARPWHCPPEMQALQFSEFIRTPWRTIADRDRYFPGLAETGGAGQPLQLDRDPETGRPFPDILALRRAKLCALSSFLGRDCTLVFTRLETVQKNPEAWLDRVASALKLVRTGPFRPVVRRLGSRLKPAVDTRPTTPETLSPEDLDWLRARIDRDQESALGYDYA